MKTQLAILLLDVPIQFEKAHLNYSTSHVDVIFGDPSVTIIAHTKNGEVIPLMQDGKWSI